MLLSLAGVHRRFRAFSASRLWSKLSVCTVAKLGTLRELLRSAPELARHVKDFRFAWKLPGHLSAITDYPAKYGTLLELAFSDRTQVWEQFARDRRCRIEQDNPEPNAGAKATPPPRYFKDGGNKIVDPSYLWSGVPLLKSGPDGLGTDSRIKTAAELVDCVFEILGQLSSLEALVWSTPIMSIPLEACHTLAQLSTLRSLRIDLSSLCRDNTYRREHSDQHYFALASDYEAANTLRFAYSAPMEPLAPSAVSSHPTGCYLHSTP